MKEFLKALKLIRTFHITLNCPRSYFITTLRANVSNHHEIFESLRKGTLFKGTVSDDKFKIRPRRSAFFYTVSLFPSVEGTVQERDEKASIDVEVNGFNWFWIFFYGIAIFIYGGVIVSTIMNPGENQMGRFIWPFFFVHALFMLGMPYVAIRRLVSRAGRDIEKELYFLVKDYRS